MAKSPDAFRTISEVADWLGVQAHVLRFWESKFNQVKPVKRAGGRRYYRPADMQLLGGIRKLLHDDGMTIKGVQKTLREQGVAYVSGFSHPLDTEAADTDGPDAADDNVVEFHSEPRVDIAAVEDADFVDLPREAGGPADEVAQVAPAEPSVADVPKPGAAELPSFLHSPEPEAESTPQPAPAPAPIVVDAPDPPDLADLPYKPGVLARLALIRKLDPDQAARIVPIAAELREWASRDAGAA